MRNAERHHPRPIYYLTIFDKRIYNVTSLTKQATSASLIRFPLANNVKFNQPDTTKDRAEATRVSSSIQH